MATVEFQASIGADQIIRPPAGVTLPNGVVEVSVRQVAESSPAVASDPLASTRAWLLEIADEAARSNPDLPSDLAERHDHYAHGKSS